MMHLLVHQYYPELQQGDYRSTFFRLSGKKAPTNLQLFLFQSSAMDEILERHSFRARMVRITIKSLARLSI